MSSSEGMEIKGLCFMKCEICMKCSCLGLWLTVIAMVDLVERLDCRFIHEGENLVWRSTSPD